MKKTYDKEGYYGTDNGKIYDAGMDPDAYIKNTYDKSFRKLMKIARKHFRG